MTGFISNNYFIFIDFLISYLNSKTFWKMAQHSASEPNAKRASSFDKRSFVLSITSSSPSGSSIYQKIHIWKLFLWKTSKAIEEGLNLIFLYISDIFLIYLNLFERLCMFAENLEVQNVRGYLENEANELENWWFIRSFFFKDRSSIQNAFWRRTCGEPQQTVFRKI